MIHNPIVLQMKKANTDPPQNVGLDPLQENHMQDVVGKYKLSKHTWNKLTRFIVCRLFSFSNSWYSATTGQEEEIHLTHFNQTTSDGLLGVETTFI